MSLDWSRPYTLWAGILGGVALTLATHGTDQFLVQRLLSARSARAAARGLVLSGFIVFAQFIVFLLIGVMLFVYYQQTPLPQPLTRTDEILPMFVVSSLTHGLAGFIVAAIVAAALSPSLNAMAATTVNDFYLRYVRPDADQATQMRVSRQATVAWGIVQLGVALARPVDGSIGARRRTGRVVIRIRRGPRRVSPRHARCLASVSAKRWLGMIAGLVTMTACGAWTTVAFTWYVFIGAVTTCGVAWMLSRVTGRAGAGRPRVIQLPLRRRSSTKLSTRARSLRSPPKSAPPAERYGRTPEAACLHAAQRGRHRRRSSIWRR